MPNNTGINNFIARFLRWFFYHLYHKFAWSYDLVAWLVSLGQWQKWVLSVLEFLNTSKQGLILELGHGPGKLLTRLSQIGVPAIGMDESQWMSRQASKNLRERGFNPKLVNGLAENPPFASGVFKQVVATFPSEYIYADKTLREVHRVLVPGGSLVILPFAWITGKRWYDRFGAWLFQITGQSPRQNHEEIGNKIIGYFQNYGFTTHLESIVFDNSVVTIIVAIKTI